MTWDSKFWGINNYLSDLERKGRNLVVIIDPHIKNDEGYQIFAKAKSREVTSESEQTTYCNRSN